MHGKPYTPKEDKLIIKFHNLPILDLVAKIPDRTKDSIYERIAILRRENKIPVGNTKTAWTSKEKNILKEHYDKPIEILLEKLPGRTTSGIQTRIFKMKEEGLIERNAKRLFKKFSPVETEWLKANSDLGIDEKCKMLDRDKMSIFNKEREFKKKIKDV